MKNFKLQMILAGILWWTLTGLAQQYSPLTLLSASTNGAKSAAWVPVAGDGIIPMTKHDRVELLLKVSSDKADDCTVTAYFAGSVDGTNFPRFPAYELAVAIGAAGETFTAATNLSNFAPGYLKLL